MTSKVQKQPTPNFLWLLLVHSFIFAFTHLILKIHLTNKLFRCLIMLRSKHLHQNHCGGNKSFAGLTCHINNINKGKGHKTHGVGGYISKLKQGSSN